MPWRALASSPLSTQFPSLCPWADVTGKKTQTSSGCHWSVEVCAEVGADLCCQCGLFPCKTLLLQAVFALWPKPFPWISSLLQPPCLCTHRALCLMSSALPCSLPLSNWLNSKIWGEKKDNAKLNVLLFLTPVCLPWLVGLGMFAGTTLCFPHSTGCGSLWLGFFLVHVGFSNLGSIFKAAPTAEIKPVVFGLT